MTPQAFSTSLLGWHDFYLASAGATAALLGLLFVGVSTNLGDHFVDIAATLDRKVDAIGRHASQYGAEYLAFARKIAAATAADGVQAGYSGLVYAEAFKVRFEGHPRLLHELGGRVAG